MFGINRKLPNRKLVLVFFASRILSVDKNRNDYTVDFSDSRHTIIVFYKCHLSIKSTGVYQLDHSIRAEKEA
jgi:hypothetical protein